MLVPFSVLSLSDSVAFSPLCAQNAPLCLFSPCQRALSAHARVFLSTCSQFLLGASPKDDAVNEHNQFMTTLITERNPHRCSFS